MIAEATPLQLTVAVLVWAVLALFWVYTAARLCGWGVAKSWREFWEKCKKQNKGGDR